MSEEKRNIYQRMLSVMREVSYIKKEDKRVNGQYTFASHDKVVAEVRKAHIKHGIIMVPQTLDIHESEIPFGWEYENKQKAGKKMVTRTRADINWHFVNAEDPSDFVVVPTFGYGVDESDKGAGKSISYSKKYAILTAYLLETGDDPERSHNSQETTDHDKWQEIATNTMAGLNIATSDDEINRVTRDIKPFFQSMPRWYKGLITDCGKAARDRVKKELEDPALKSDKVEVRRGEVT